MMYGHGDVPNPASDTVELLEEMTVSFITETVRKPGLCDQPRQGGMLIGMDGLVLLLALGRACPRHGKRRRWRCGGGGCGQRTCSL